MHDTAFMVTFLRPRVGKIQVDSLQGVIRDLVLQDVDRVMSNQAKVLEACLASADQAVTDTGFVYFNAEIVRPPTFASLLYQRVSVAETDFERRRRLPAEQKCKVERFFLKFQPVMRPQFLERLSLRRR